MKIAIAIAFATCNLLVGQAVTHAQVIEVRNLPLQLIDDVEVAVLDAGVVMRLHVQPGDHVEPSETLFELDRDLHQVQTVVKRKAWMVAEAEAKNDVNLRFSEKTLLLNSKILEKSLNAISTYAKSISETEIDKLRLERDQALLSIEQAQLEHDVAALTAQLRDEEKNLAEIELLRRSITAPLAGLVVNVTVQPGEAIGAGETAVRIVSTRKLRVIASIDRQYAFKLKKGHAAEFILAIDDEPTTFPAKIVFVSPEIRFTEQTFDVWAEVENLDGQLLPGMKGSLKITPKP